MTLILIVTYLFMNLQCYIETLKDALIKMNYGKMYNLCKNGQTQSELSLLFTPKIPGVLRF